MGDVLPRQRLSLQDYGRARQMYGRQLELHPDHSSAHAGVVWSLLAAGDEQTARARLHLMRSSQLDRDRYDVKRADIEHFLGERAEALVLAMGPLRMVEPRRDQPAQGAGDAVKPPGRARTWEGRGRPCRSRRASLVCGR
jgi:hypothetical protein